MKKFLSLALSLLLACACMSVFAEETTTIEITFDGSYLEFEEYGFKVYLPNEWNIYESEDYFFFCGDEAGEQFMCIDVVPTDGETSEEVATTLAEQGGIDGVEPMLINGLQFYLYEAPDDNAFGAYINTQNNVYCINFVFAPYGDAEFMDLATQIMASVDTI